MSKVIDLQSYREKHGQSATDNEILLDVVYDASREMLVNAIWIAKDLDIDIEDMHFIEQMSSSFHHYSEALKQGFGIAEKAEKEAFVLSEDVTTWKEEVNKEIDKEPDE